MWIEKEDPELVSSEEMSYVDLHEGIFHFIREQRAAQMQPVSLCSHILHIHFGAQVTGVRTEWAPPKRHTEIKGPIKGPPLCYLSASHKCSSQGVGLCGHTDLLWAALCAGGFQQPLEGVINRWDHRHLQTRRSTSQSCQAVWICISNSGSIPCCETQLPFATFN